MSLGIIRRKFGKVILVILATIGFCGLFVWISMWAFSIQAIEVDGSSVDVKVDSDKISRNLLFFPSETLRKHVLADNPWLSGVEFQKKFPHTLRIVATLRTPVAILVSGERTVIVDKDAMVLTDGDGGRALPHVNIKTSPFRVGQILTDARVTLAISLLEHLKDQFVFESITDYDGTYLLAKSSQVNIYIAQDKPVGESTATLQTLLAGFRIKGRLPTVVDLRFDKPIVKF